MSKSIMRGTTIAASTESKTRTHMISTKVNPADHLGAQRFPALPAILQRQLFCNVWWRITQAGMKPDMVIF